MVRMMVIAMVSMILTPFVVDQNVFAAENPGWHDTFYQYRIPVNVKVEEAGWNIIPIGEADITSSINKKEELKFDPTFFAYNQFRVVQIDNKAVAPNLTAGFYLVPEGEELIREPLTGKEQKVEIATEAGGYYLVKYKTEWEGPSPFNWSPVVGYEQIFPVGSKMRKHAYMSSYEPRMLPKKPTAHENLLRSDGQPMKVTIKDWGVTSVKEISVKAVRIKFLANFKTPGRKDLMLYYQPMGGHYLTVPKLRQDKMPVTSAKVRQIGPAEKYIGASKYRLKSNSYFDVWFADTTVKLTPKTEAPKNSSAAVPISCAKNEAQSFQLVIRPKQAFTFKGIVAGDLVKGKDKIPSNNIGFYAVDYVPIVEPSHITPTKYEGMIGDPLVAVSEKKLSLAGGNHALWITVKTPAGTPAGKYNGSFTVQGEGSSSMTIPVELTVYDFELPEFSTLQSGLGGNFFAARYAKDDKVILDYHGLKETQEFGKLTTKYWEVMAQNKFYPKFVTGYGGGIKVKWSPPPEGYNVDKPGNYFKLHDWDFGDYNRRLKYYVDGLKLNSICLAHTNPTVCNRFSGVPGLRVAWGKREGEGGGTEVTRDQFDKLVLDYYREVAKNLEKHGWLDYAYILVDESMIVERILHFMRLMKSDPLTARIKLSSCMQGLEYFHYKEPGSDKHAFNGLATYMPQLDENYNRWEKYYWKDYDIEPDRSKLWNYAVYTSRLVIDVPGINNRIIGLDLFNRGASGFVVWETFWWDHERLDSDNPWENPRAGMLGNGACAYFYPPRKDGPSKEPDYTIIPSLRVMTYRESVDDYEYARILEDLIVEGEKKGRDVSQGKAVMRDIEIFFYSMVNWSQNDAWYLELRERMAEAIEKLQSRIGTSARHSTHIRGKKAKQAKMN